MHLTWKVGNGRNVSIGIDFIIGLGDYFKLPEQITKYLADISYFTLAHIKRPIWMNTDFSYWYSAKDLGLVKDLVLEWEVYTKRLNYA